MDKRIRGVPVDATVAARNLREHSTAAEQTLWHELRSRKMAGLKFRRQHPLGPYVVDFCCPERRLIIEVDGEVHDHQREYDAARSEHLNSYGYRVLRFTNQQVQNELSTVLKTINQTLTSSSPID